MGREGKQIKISLITAVLNGVTHLEQCIESVLSQRCDELEYIIIDGGSTDGTLEIIRKYEKSIDRWITEKDHGIAEAYNKGIALASGEMVGFINADDLLTKDAVSYILGTMADDAGIIYGDLIQLCEKGESYRIGANHKLLKSKMSLNFPTTYIRKSIFDSLGVFNTHYRIALDYEFLLRCVHANVTFKYCSQTLAIRSTDGISDRNWFSAIKEAKKAKDHIFGMKFIHFTSFCRSTLATWISKVMLGSFLSFLLNFYRSRFSRVKKEPIE